MRFPPFIRTAAFGSSVSKMHFAALTQVAVILFFSCGLQAQEGEVIGDRAQLQKVLDAYDQLKATLESYDATVECNMVNLEGLEVHGKYEIVKHGSLYSLSKVIDVTKEKAHFEKEDYLDMSLGYLENVDSRLGIIKTSRREKSDADVYSWTPLTLPLPSPIDLDCFCIRHGRSFRTMIDPANMKGKPRQVHVETASNGNVILTRKYPSGSVIEMIASAENGYLLTSYRDAVQSKPEYGLQHVDFTWSKLPNGKFTPKSKNFTHKFTDKSESRSWVVNSLTTPAAKKEGSYGVSGRSSE